jgi:defect-in-organelle-trafficking protein DotC
MKLLRHGLAGASFIALCIYGSSALASGAYLPMETLQSIDSSNLDQEEFASYSPSSEDSGDYRLKVVSQAALTVGAQHGFNARLEQRKSEIRLRENILDKLFDFQTLMTLASSNQNGKYLIPAILSQTEGVKALSKDSKTISIAERSYEIVRPSRLSLRAPNWRGYLLYDKKMETNLPNKLLLPKTPAERDSWKKSINKGWKTGEQMAEREMIRRLERMSQDYFGIMRNIRLTMEGKLRQTLVTYDYSATTGGGDKLSENNHTYRISSDASLGGDISSWEPIIMDARDSLAFPIEKGVYIDPMGRKK